MTVEEMQRLLRVLAHPGRAVSARLRRKIVRRRLEPLIRSQATELRTLDLGCGGSRYSRYFPRRLGLDLSFGRGVQVIADAHDLPFRTASFPVALSTEMLEHTREPQRVVDEILRVLEPGGTVILTTRFLFPVHEAPYDYFRFTRYGLEHLFRGFQELTVRPDTGPLETLAVLFQRLVFQGDIRGGRVARGLFLLGAQILRRLDCLVIRTYGDYARTTMAEEVFASGYCVVARANYGAGSE